MGVRKYNINKEFFTVPNEVNSYWAGFIAADGCIKRDDTVAISLGIKDKGHLERFCRDVGYSNEVKVRENMSYGRMRGFAEVGVYCVPEWTMFLKNNFNITRRKTLTLQPPTTLNNTMALAFIIGYLDGDGCIFISHSKYKDKVYKRLGMEFCGTKSMLDWIKFTIDSTIQGIKANCSVRQCSNNKRCFSYCVKGKDTVKILEYLDDIDVPKMRRKWEKIQQL